jgi:hypothetical protein
VLDGKATSYFEWLAAGSVETETPPGAMRGGERRAPMVTSLLYGFDLTHLYVRLDLARPAAQTLRDGIRYTVNFTTPADRKLILIGERDGAAAFLVQRTADGALQDFLETSARVAAGEILEAAIPFADLGLSPKDPFAFFVSVQSGSTELERHPVFRPVEGRVPEATFERMLWKA